MIKFSNLAIVIGSVVALSCHGRALAADASQLTARSLVVAVGNRITDASRHEPKSDKPVEPARPDNTDVDPDIKGLVTSFEQTRDAFVSQQKDLTAQIKGAAEDQREKIREDLKRNQDQFAAQREQFRDQLKEAQEKLRDYMKKLKDESIPPKGTGKPRGA